MRVLFVAPLPPPINGQSIVSKQLYDAIDEQNTIYVADMSKEGNVDGIDSFKRIKEVINLIRRVRILQSKSDRIYIQISESLAGNIKDLFFFLMCRKNLDKVYIQLHGGTIKSNIYDKYPLLHRVNKYFISKMAGVLISGESHRETFSDKIAKEKIHIIPNFASDDLFISNLAQEQKASNQRPINVLYMSSLIPLKGYLLLLEAIETMPDYVRNQFEFHFAGGCNDPKAKNSFLDRIDKLHNVNYHGLVSGEDKQKLFFDAHVLCLPTMYFEGQSVCVLEAYSSGCTVVSTGKGGLVDIFEDGVHGIKIEENSVQSIILAFEKLLADEAIIAKTGRNNRIEADQNYRPSSYNNKCLKAIDLNV